MCGIGVIINKSGKKVSSKQLKVLANTVSHRGPDSEGYYVKDNIGIIHRRLSIIDLSKSGNQPMKIGDHIISFNGEIFNYIELREELKNQGIEFKTDTDTEVLLKAYIFWGKIAFEKFNGMWSLSIFNQKTNELIFSRDRFGIKPLYYFENKDYLIFASEIKQIIEVVGQKFQANKKILLDYLVLGLENHETQTFFHGIYNFPQSNYALVEDLHGVPKVRFTKYYEINYETNKATINEFKFLIEDSIKLRLRSDIKVGSCASGGIDSSAIVGFANKNKLNNSKFDIFHINTRNEAGESEFKYVKKLEDNLDVKLHDIKINNDLIKNYVDETIICQEEPFVSPSVVLQHILMKKAKDIGCIVLLDGQGADETLLGYERYFVSLLNSVPISKFPKMMKLLIQNSKLSFVELIKYIVYFKSPFLRKFYLIKRHFYLKKQVKSNINFEILKRLSKSYQKLEQLQNLELFQTQLPHLLRYEDKNSMYYSIETRLPFLDYRLVELSLNLPLELKINSGWSKYILRKSIDKILPKEITWRKNKMGFDFDTKTFLKDNFSEIFEEIKSSNIINDLCDIESLEKNSFKIETRDLWKLFNIARWARLYNIEKIY